MKCAFVLLALIGAASAACPNDCSGHGYCNQYSACNCFRNWMGADCSGQSCRWAHSFIDVPQGDLNGDGRLDIPNIYAVSLCKSTTFFPAGATAPYWKSFNGNQHTSQDSLAADAKCTGTTGTACNAGEYTTITVKDTETPTATEWNRGLEILENVYPADEATEGNDPDGIVEMCMERDADLKFAILVHVKASRAPGAICQPNEWRRDEQHSDSATGRFSHCVDVNPTGCDDDDGQAGNSACAVTAYHTPDLLRTAQINAVDSNDNLVLYDSISDDFNALSTRDDDVYVGMWSDMTYKTQMTNSPLWERYPADHFHAGTAMGIDVANDITPPVTDDMAGTAASTAYSKDDWDEGHFYAECSAKGLCDRSTGLCQCFPGFTGDGCTRTACPNDCSGHGTCQRLVDANDQYLAWDAYKTQQCVCDPGYTGPNCALRICPKGDDPVTRLSTSGLQAYTGDDGLHHENGGLAHTGHRTQSAEIQVIGVAVYTNLLTGTRTAASPTVGDAKAPFALEFTDEMGDKWTTRTIDFRHGDVAADVALDIETALEDLPNSVIPNIEVNPQYISVPTGCIGTGGTFECVSYGSAIPNNEWLAANSNAAAITNAAQLTVVNGRLTAFSGTDTDAVWTDYTNSGQSGNAESLYAITFVENSGDIPMLGARYQWEFLTTDASIAGGGAGSSLTGETSCMDNIHGAASAVTCTYSQNDKDGQFDVEPIVATTHSGFYGYSFYVQELFKGDREEVLCSNRGLCDYSTGLCKCFNGFTKHDCSLQNSLASA
jgi:hypothetical protein